MTSELRRTAQTPDRYLQVLPAPSSRIHEVVRKGALLAAAATVAGTIGLAVSACSDRETAQAQAANTAIGVQTSQFFVTIENKAGAPLINLKATIVAAGGLPFTSLVSRMENGEKRNKSLNDFSSSDGTTFSLRSTNPRTVRVEAEDVTGKKYDAEVPWK
jgi:hypothetical protein